MDTTQSTRRGRVSIFERPTTSKRGHTPSKLPPDQEPETKPKLSLEQQLEIFERIKRGDYKRGIGVSQFYEQAPVPSSSSSAPRTNLMREFDKLQDSKVAAGDPIFSSTIVGTNEAPEEVGPAHKQWLEETAEEYTKLPKYIKDFDKILVLYENYVSNIMQIADLKAENNFEELFPQREIVNTFIKMDKLVVTLNKFLSKSVLEKKQIFEEQKTVSKAGKKNKAPAILRCDVKDQDKFIAIFQKIPHIIEKMRTALEKLQGNSQWSGRIQEMSKKISTLEEGLKNLSMLEIERKTELQRAEDMKMEGQSDDSRSISDVSSSMSSLAFSPV